VLAQRIPGYDPGESPLETRIVTVLARYGFPPPVLQHQISFGPSRYRLDFAYPEPKVFLEGNGFGAHSIASDLDKDARRQNQMVADGWRPLVFTWRMTDAEIVASMDALYDRAAARWR
jgi:very-short-patch-repair endonuclease